MLGIIQIFVKSSMILQIQAVPLNLTTGHMKPMSFHPMDHLKISGSWRKTQLLSMFHFKSIYQWNQIQHYDFTG